MPPNNPTVRIEDKSVRPKIPGLAEDRLKSEKKKKRKRKVKQKKSEEEKPLNEMSRDDFLVSPHSGIVKENEFVFSDYDDSGEDETFEDSMETPTDSEKANTDLFTPVNLKSAFDRVLQAKSTASPNLSSSTPKPGTATKSSARSRSSDPATKQSAVKRIASSPADAKDQKKKSRAQSMIPAKK